MKYLKQNLVEKLRNVIDSYTKLGTLDFIESIRA